MTALRISGDHVQAGTGHVVPYTVEYDLNGKTGNWRGTVLLLGGNRHTLAGGVITNVARDTIAPAVVNALNAEIDDLDIGALNRANGN